MFFAGFLLFTAAANQYRHVDYSVGYHVSFLHVAGGKNDIDPCFPKPEVTSSRLVLSTTQRYSVYCHRGGKKPENIHI